MNLREFQLYVPTTMNDLGSRLNNEIHMVLGAGSEIMAELPQAMAAFDFVNIGEELGDAEWFLCNYANIHGIALPKYIQVSSSGGLAVLSTAIGTIMDITKREFAYGKAEYKKQPVTIEIREALLLNAFRSINDIAISFKIDMEKVRDRIKAKLEARYGKDQGFSADRALNRDLEAERQALES